ncbi:MAG: hypothetical protein GX069_06095 [Tissierellia bacterium]|nr:hypothetical protein [Tissierellia bacterium]
MYEQDYIIRLVRNMVKIIAKAFLGKEGAKYEITDEQNLTQTDLLHRRLLHLLKEGKINEAENMLFEEVDTNDIKYLELALDFYNRLNEMDDEFLENNNFSRKEVEEGLKDLLKEFGISI